MLKNRKNKKTDSNIVAQPVEKKAEKKENMAREFLSDFDNHVKKASLGFYNSNSFLNKNEKEKIKLLHIALLSDLKLISQRICQANLSNNKNRASDFNELFTSVKNNIDILNQADHIAYERFGLNNEADSIGFLKTSAVCIHENIKTKLQNLKEVNPKIYIRRSKAAAEDLIESLNLHEVSNNKIESANTYIEK